MYSEVTIKYILCDRRAVLAVCCHLISFSLLALNAIFAHHTTCFIATNIISVLLHFAGHASATITLFGLCMQRFHFKDYSSFFNITLFDNHNLFCVQIISTAINFHDSTHQIDWIYLAMPMYKFIP